MNSARQLLRHDSHAHLTQVGWEVESALEEPGAASMAPDAALRVGIALFSSIAELLRACLDAEDFATFREIELAWSQMIDDIWLPGFPGHHSGEGHSERSGQPPAPQTLELLRWREVLRLGLAMWAIWRLTKSEGPLDGQSAHEQALQQLASHFETVEYVLDAYEAATDLDWHDRTPFTGWFLSDLPTGAAHFIPTLNELLRSTLLLAARLVTPDTPLELRPRELFVLRRDEIKRELNSLREAGPRWALALGVAPRAEGQFVPPETARNRHWLTKLERLAGLLEKGSEAQNETEKAKVREQPLDPARVATVRDTTLREAAGAGPLRATLKLQGAVEKVRAKPEEIEGLVYRIWAPKSFFTPDSRVVGMDMMGQDLARSTARAEVQQLQGLLPEQQPSADGPSVLRLVQKVIVQMRERGLAPSLIVTPISWRLQHELGLEDFRRSPTQHALVPLAHANDFIGIIDDVPVLDLAPLAEDRLWVLDLPAFMRMVEWPSENDSGVSFELRIFDANQAVEFIAQHPEVRGTRSAEETALDLQEKVLISVHLCWLLQALEPDAAVAVEVPEEFRRD